MASSTCAALKGTFVIAVWVLLLFHSARGQPPPAPSPAPTSSALDCANCPSNCTLICQASVDSRAHYCNTSFGPAAAYEGCLERLLANQDCKGNSYAARGSCTIGTCTPELCGNPCVQETCKSCTATAYSDYYTCMAPVPKIMQNCMPACISSCRNYYNCGING